MDQTTGGLLMGVEPGPQVVSTQSRDDPGGDPVGSGPPGDAPPEAGPGEESRPAGYVGQRGLRAWVVPRRRSLVGWVILVVAFAVSTATLGLPESDDTLLIWLAAALLVASLDDLSRWRRGVLVDWLPLYAVLVIYATLRGYASHTLWGPFARPQVDFDKLVGFGKVPTVRLQRRFFNPNHLHVWDYAAWAVYTSHFFVSYIVAAVLWKRRHDRFRRFIRLFVGLTFVGYVGYVLYPAMPPWMSSWHHLTGGPVYRVVPVVWDHLGIRSAAAIFTKGSAYDNDVAAMPSLHAAYPMLLLLFFWSGARRWVRALLVAYVLAMAITLVYAGEHFVADEVAGWICAIAVYFWGSRLLDRWDARRWLRGRPGRPSPSDRHEQRVSPDHALPVPATLRSTTSAVTTITTSSAISAVTLNVTPTTVLASAATAAATRYRCEPIRSACRKAASPARYKATPPPSARQAGYE
jgi:membrane-associated phospholipid phosphatase